MKKQFGSKVYDTATAKKIGCWTAEDVKEILYLKRSGEYFIAHTSIAGEKIVPVSFEQAREWTFKKNPKDYEKFFGEITENSATKVISISVTNSLHEQMKRKAQTKSMSVSEYIANLVQNDK